MTEQNRRDFLKQLATGTIYAAPVVSTLVAPRSASGQGMVKPSPKDMGMDMGMGMGQQRNLSKAPWGKRPPGG